MIHLVQTPRSDTTVMDSPRSILDTACSPANERNPFPAPRLRRTEKCAKGLLKTAISTVIAAGIGTTSYGWTIALSAPAGSITLSIVTGIALLALGKYCMKSVDRHFNDRLANRAIQADPREPRAQLNQMQGIV